MPQSPSTRTSFEPDPSPWADIQADIAAALAEPWNTVEPEEVMPLNPFSSRNQPTFREIMQRRRPEVHVHVTLPESVWRRAYDNYEHFMMQQGVRRAELMAYKAELICPPDHQWPEGLDRWHIPGGTVYPCTTKSWIHCHQHWLYVIEEHRRHQRSARVIEHVPGGRSNIPGWETIRHGQTATFHGLGDTWQRMYVQDDVPLHTPGVLDPRPDRPSVP